MSEIRQERMIEGNKVVIQSTQNAQERISRCNQIITDNESTQDERKIAVKILDFANDYILASGLSENTENVVDVVNESVDAQISEIEKVVDGLTQKLNDLQAENESLKSENESLKSKQSS